MEERNLDFEIPLSRDQWDQLGQTAARLGPHDWGYDWREGDEARIHVFMRNEEARGAWSDFVVDEGAYGDTELEVAHFVFNDGRPYARIEAPPQVQPPNVTPDQERSMQAGLEHFVRDKWEMLMKESGIHHTRGHTDHDRGRPL
ncbi:MAG TPA: hypothetical protein VGR37_18125 [Longimicrobiaceae bacterium]|nr:hypothetical protein [Longimicrobiaceae bacterium]